MFYVIRDQNRKCTSNTGCLKIREFRIQIVVGKDPVELEKYFGLPEEDMYKDFNFVQYIAVFISTVTKYYSSYVAVLFLRKITKS
jgi:hypothetical protein